MTAAPPTKYGSLQCSLDGITIVTREVSSSCSQDDSRAWQNRSVSASVTSHKLAITAGLTVGVVNVPRHVAGYLAAVR